MSLLREYAWTIAAVVGALIGLSYIERLTVAGAITAFAAGLALSLLMAPIAVYILDPAAVIRDHVLIAIAWVFGLVGFVLCGALIDGAHAIRAALPDAIRRIFERKSGGEK